MKTGQQSYNSPKNDNKIENKVELRHQQNPEISNVSSDSQDKQAFITQFSKTKRVINNTNLILKEVPAFRLIKAPKLSPIVSKNSPKTKSIDSWADLTKLKTKYKSEMFKRKSKQQIFQENLEIIDKIQAAGPRVDVWNDFKPIRSTKGSQKSLIKQKNKEIQKKIQQVEPRIFNWNLYKPVKSSWSLQKRKEKRKIQDQNRTIVQRVEFSPPKVKCWSEKKPIRNNQIIINRREWKNRLMEQNLKIIQKVEEIEPKVQSWTDLRSLKMRFMQQKQKDDCEQKLLNLKKLIEETQGRLKAQEEKNNLSRHKTLPIRLRLQNYEHKKSLERLTKKIDTSKSNINCWGSNLESKKLNSSQNSNDANKTVKRGSIVLAKQLQKLNYMRKQDAVKFPHKVLLTKRGHN